MFASKFDSDTSIWFVDVVIRRGLSVLIPVLGFHALRDTLANPEATAVLGLDVAR